MCSEFGKIHGDLQRSEVPPGDTEPPGRCVESCRCGQVRTAGRWLDSSHTSWKPQPTNCSIGDGSHWEIMSIFFWVIFVVVHVSTLWAWHILRYISTAFLRLDSWSLDDTTPVWSCQQVVSRAWEVEKPWLKDEVFGSLDVVFGVFRVGVTINVARSRSAMEIKKTYWTIPAIIYPHLILHKVAHEKKNTKSTRKIGRIPSSLWTSLESRVTWNSRVLLNPFCSELRKKTRTPPTESIGGRVPKETTWCFVVDWGPSHGHHGCDTSFWKPLGPKGSRDVMSRVVNVPVERRWFGCGLVSSPCWNLGIGLLLLIGCCW